MIVEYFYKDKFVFIFVHIIYSCALDKRNDDLNSNERQNQYKVKAKILQATQFKVKQNNNAK